MTLVVIYKINLNENSVNNENITDISELRKYNLIWKVSKDGRRNCGSDWEIIGDLLNVY